MGQCMSRKAAGAFAASAAATHNRPGEKMHKKQQGQLQSPGDDNTSEMLNNKRPAHTKGVSTSFGFRRRPTTAPSITANPNAARRLASTNASSDLHRDRNGNGNTDDDTEPLTSNVAPIGGRSTPRLMPPKKEGSTARVNRFGFRQPQINRLNKIADLNNATVNNNLQKAQHNNYRPQSVTAAFYNNRNRTSTENNPPQAERYMLQSTQLPRPEPIRLIETKTAKTLANNNKKVASTYQHEEHSSKDGSSTEDSGVTMGSTGIERLNSSPIMYGARRSASRSRNLEVLRSGHIFDVRDHSEESVDNNIPRLPSVFQKSPQNHNKTHVREMALEYQRQHLLLDDNRRKISITSSEGFSDDYNGVEDEKNCREILGNEKSFVRSIIPYKSFLKSRSDTSSTDDTEWFHAGEAMADDVSFSISSSDNDSKENVGDEHTTAAILRSLLNAPLMTSRSEHRHVLLTLEDPKFAAVAKAAITTSSTLLDDETSPVDSLLSCTESEELFKRKLNKSSSNSKDVNEKLTPPSPGTPTNASNSLSLSDNAKDDFLIDDEIADQPALVFEDCGGSIRARDFSSLSENTITVHNTPLETTPKFKKRLGGIEGSPLALRNRKTLLASRTGSLDTLSPCESIASDDLMMDYDYSQSSGVEDLDRNTQNHGFASLDETLCANNNINRDGLRDWASLLGNCVLDNGPLSSVPHRGSKLLWSRTGTPNSITDSPNKSLDGKSKSTTARPARPSVTSSPLRLRASHLSSTGYESDDNSVRLDRANHTAMKQDIGSIKNMLIKLKRILNEWPCDDNLMRSETHIPFNGQPPLTNGLFTGLNSAEVQQQQDEEEDAEESTLELAELRRQVLFLQGQLEDKDRTVQTLHDQMVQMENLNYSSNSAPTSTTVIHCNQSESTCNAATQTDRVRPVSAGPSLLNGSANEGTPGSLVSANESPPSLRSRPPSSNESTSRRSSPSIWRRPGEPPSPRYSSIPRRATSRSRTPSTLPS